MVTTIGQTVALVLIVLFAQANIMQERFETRFGKLRPTDATLSTTYVVTLWSEYRCVPIKVDSPNLFILFMLLSRQKCH